LLVSGFTVDYYYCKVSPFHISCTKVESIETSHLLYRVGDMASEEEDNAAEQEDKEQRAT